MFWPKNRQRSRASLAFLVAFQEVQQLWKVWGVPAVECGKMRENWIDLSGGKASRFWGGESRRECHGRGGRRLSSFNDICSEEKRSTARFFFFFSEFDIRLFILLLKKCQSSSVFLLSGSSVCSRVIVCLRIMRRFLKGGFWRERERDDFIDAQDGFWRKGVLNDLPALAGCLVYSYLHCRYCRSYSSRVRGTTIPSALLLHRVQRFE